MRPVRAAAAGAAWLGAFRPAPMAIDLHERLRIVAGAGLGIAVTALLSHLAGQPASLTWIVAPMGASAVLVFGVPASPLAQPWSVVGGNVLSALVGVACARWLAPPDLAAAVAVAGAIAVMLSCRCLHPPGGASALMMVLGHVTDPHAALLPVLLNSVLLASVGVAYNNLTGRRYPHRQVHAPAAAASSAQGITEDDVDAVLARYNQILDVSADDLRDLLAQTQMHAHERRMTDLRCEDIMSRDLVTVEFGTPLHEAWTLLRRRGIKALPVVDRVRRVVGIVTLADFLSGADLDVHPGFEQRLRAFLRPSGLTHSDRPEVVGQIMTRRVRVTSASRHLADLIPLFGSSGHHHIPVIDDDARLVGIITQSDLVAAIAADRSTPP